MKRDVTVKIKKITKEKKTFEKMKTKLRKKMKNKENRQN